MKNTSSTGEWQSGSDGSQFRSGYDGKTAASVQIPIGSNVCLISHTHPELLQGGVAPFKASGADYNVLKLPSLAINKRYDN